MPLKDIVERISEQMLRRLGTGDLAELRRMTIGAVESLAYWRLAADCGFLDSKPERWAPIVQIMAILTPKGHRLASDRLHDAEHGLGKVLADGGNPAWSGGGTAEGERTPRPFLSERRFAQFLAAPAGQAADSLIRLARSLAPNRDRGRGVNCLDIANLLLSTDRTDALRKIARDYYKQFDSVARSAESEENAQ